VGGSMKDLDRRIGVRTALLPAPDTLRVGSGDAASDVPPCAPPPPAWGGDRGGGSLKRPEPPSGYAEQTRGNEQPGAASDAPRQNKKAPGPKPRGLETTG